MTDRVVALEEIIGEYQNERVVEASRLDRNRVQRAKLELAREVLLDHEEIHDADHLKVEIHDLDHRIQASEEVLSRLDRLIAIFQKSLDKIREGSKTP